MKTLNIYVAGHQGMVGSAIVRSLKNKKNVNLITCTRKDLDLTNQASVKSFFESNQPDQVYIAAAKVGGIYASHTFPAEFIYQNLMIQANIIDAAFQNGTKKLLFLGSSCIYPKFATQPITENSLLSGKLEETNEPFAIAKIAGIKLCESYNRQYGISHGIDYRSVIPSNLYGLGDNYHPENSHVIPALIRRFHEAKLRNQDLISVWGSGTPRREFLYVDDMASASIFLMNIDKEIYDRSTQPMLNHVNIGCGYDLTIKELAETIANIVGYKGKVVFDQSKPDGTPRKMVDSSCLRTLGWQPQIPLKQGLTLSYENFKKHYATYTNI